MQYALRQSLQVIRICTGSVMVNTISHLFYCMQVRLIAMNELWSGRLRGVQGADLLCQVRHIHLLFPFQIHMCLLLFNTFFLLFFSKKKPGKVALGPNYYFRDSVFTLRCAEGSLVSL